MAGQLETNRFYEFGPYRLDRHARVLLRDGAIVPLTPKVLDTLLALVESRNGVVSKDELLRLVWPDSFVEESNLAQNISVLRKALGQSPDQVTYIETIPKRGYRFVPEVRSAPAVEQPKADSSYPAVVPPMTAPPSLVPARRVRIMTLTAVAAGLCVIAAFWYLPYRQPGGARGHSISVLPLKNLSGDPQQEYFADGITELLTEELSKALPIRVTSRTSAM